MSAELLRRAAAKMRENAEAATPGPWCDAPHGARTDCRCVKTRAAGRGRDYGEFVAMYVTRDAAHIASWHPNVALAIAKAMDDVAIAWEIANEANDGYVYDPDDDPLPFEDTVDAGWVNVARAYLGEA